jgi:hypothetical protein
MHLASVRLVGFGPFDDTVVPFCHDDGEPRMVSVVHGGGGVGKTSLLTAISMTRPGHCVVPPPALVGSEGSPRVIAEFRLGQDDPDRPHPLCLATPNARVFDDDDAEVLRRREQSLFDKLAREGGFVFVSFGASRWFSRQPIALSAPLRSVARYDVRAASAFDDASRADLARETKQALAYAAITGALTAGGRQGREFGALAAGMLHAVDALVGLSGFKYLGVEPRSLEPRFAAADNAEVRFDTLPTRVRHLAAIAALTVRALWAAYPARDPLGAEGIVVIDEVDLHQDEVVLTGLVPALRRALPLVQWIVTTTSPVVAASCEAGEVLALRKTTARQGVDLYFGASARTH